MSATAPERRREPVYEFDYISDPAIIADVHEAYWELKQKAPPVFWTSAHGGHWVVTNADAAIEVLRHPDRFSSRFLSIPPNPDQPRMIPESLDPPEHRPYRQLLRPYFESKAIEPLEPRIREWAEKLIDGVVAKGECEFVDALGSRFPVSVFMELFGFPLDQFDFFRATVVEYFNAQVAMERRIELTMQILGTLNALLEARRAEPQDDLVSKLIASEFEGRQLDHEELMSICFLMFLAGLDTVVNALSFGMRHLSHDEALRNRMIEDPAAIPAIVDELMRRYTFVSTPRYITRDTEIAGTKVYEGDSVLVPLHMVGWDEKLTECPAEVRLDRPHCRHAGFGSGVHTCLGIHLARLEMTVFYETWAKKIGHFRLKPDQHIVTRGGSVQAIEALHLEWNSLGDTPMSDIPVVHLHIGHEKRTTGSGGTRTHIHPVTGEALVEVPLAGPAEVAEAVARAEAAREGWRRTSPEARGAILYKLADLLMEKQKEFGRMAALDGGTPLMQGERGVETAVSWMRYYAGWCDKLTGELMSTFDTRGEFSYSVPEPIGIVGIINTWNGPLIGMGMKVSPALAAGNCVILKPAEITPFAPELFAQCCKEAGIPDGVISVLPGTGEAGDAIVRHPKVRKISFTGGPITARKILTAAAEQIKPSVMELGGKSASLVFPDCDLQAAAERAVFWTIGCLAGQGCALPTRQLVHADIYDEFVEKMVEIAKLFKVGDPMEPGVMVGPVISAAAVERITGMFDRATADNACKFLIGGKRAGGELAKGNFIEPTIMVDVNPDHEIAQVEIFGPAVAILKFHTEDEAVAIANNSEYGLAAYIQSNDIQRVHRLAERLNAGGVYVNGGFQINSHTPFGGVGISGFGKEGGKAGIDEFLHYKTVTVGVGAPIFPK